MNRRECPYCGGEGNIAGEDGLEQCELCGGEGEIDSPKNNHREYFNGKKEK